MNLQSMKHRFRGFVENPRQQALTVMAVAMTMMTAAHAGSGGQEFQQIALMLTGWAQGGLGIVLALAGFLVGIGVGIVRQSAMAVVYGLGVAVILYFAPTAIVGILTATGGLGIVHPLLLG
jgi:conjugal transfer pilus assembly protein TraA